MPRGWFIKIMTDKKKGKKECANAATHLDREMQRAGTIRGCISAYV
jgi:hypothetical protein